MGIPLLAGRTFTAGNRDEANAVIVNKNFIERYLDGQPSIGATFKWRGNTLFQIAGVVGDTKNMTIGEENQPQLYQPLSQAYNGRPQIQFVLRSATPPVTQLEAVRRVLRRVEPRAGVEVDAMYSSIGLAFLLRQVGAALMGGTGILGLLLAAIGLYGVTAYSVRVYPRGCVSAPHGRHRDAAYRPPRADGIRTVAPHWFGRRSPGRVFRHQAASHVPGPRSRSR